MIEKDKLKELFKKIEYTPFPEMTTKANLANQFTDYALDCIVDEMLANGIIVPPDVSTKNSISHSERCVICGEEIPEGRQVCPKCEKGGIQE